jgi:hypothetical protein
MVKISSLSYQNKEIPKSKDHPFNEQLRLAMEKFQESGIDIGTKSGITAVFESPTLYSQYRDLMYGDIAVEDTKDILSTLLDKDRNMVLMGDDIVGEIAGESGSVANVTTFAYLNGPVIRAIWARCIVSALMRTVALKQPTYTASFDLPFVVDNGVRKDLPYSMVLDGDLDSDWSTPASDAGRVAGLRKLAVVNGYTPDVGTIDVANNAFVLKNGTVKGNLLAAAGLEFSQYDGHAVDRRITISNITVAKTLSVVENVTTSTDPETLPITIYPSSKTGKAGDVIFTFETMDTGRLSETDDEPDVLNVIIDLSTGRIRATASSPAILSFTVNAFLSSEDNRTPISIKQEQHSLEVMVGTGQHVMIDTPVELLQEYPTSHQGADLTVTLTDISSETYAGDMNVEMLTFYKKSIQSPSSMAYIPQAVVRSMNISDTEFNIRVAHGDNPSAYVDQQFKKFISYYINQIRSITRIEDGFWNMVGHANNVMHVPDFKTEGYAQLNGDSDDARNDVMGFRVGYVFGFSTNVINGKVRCLYTPEIGQKQGIISFFTSMDEKRPTYIFHPFSYTVSRGYQNPTNTVIPTIMITKRHTFQEFSPSAFHITLTGNDGTQFTNPIAPTTPSYTVAS